MTGCVEEGKSLLLQGEIELRELSGLPVFSLLRDHVRDSCLLPRLHLVLSSIALGVGELLLINLLQLSHNVASEG